MSTSIDPKKLMGAEGLEPSIIKFWADKDGQRSRRTVILAHRIKYKTETEARIGEAEQIARLLSEENKPAGNASRGTLSDFILQRYFPHLEGFRSEAEGAHHIEPTTINIYKVLYDAHVKGHEIASQFFSQVTTPMVQNFLHDTERKTNGDGKKLHHKSILRIRAFLSGVFTYAIQQGLLTVNPVRHTKAGGRTEKFNGETYSFAEIKTMCRYLPEPAKTVVATAAFTGMTRSELRGFRWSDYADKKINVTRKVINIDGRQYVGPLKTDARAGGIPVIDVLQVALAAYRKKYPPMSTGYVFRSTRDGRSLNLDNLVRREILPVLGDHNVEWKGWHAFRRGLGSRLAIDLNVPAETVQEILRHADVSTTLGFYIKSSDADQTAAMGKINHSVRDFAKFWK